MTYFLLGPVCTHRNNNKWFKQLREVKKEDFFMKNNDFQRTTLFVMLYVLLGDEKWSILAPTVDGRVRPILRTEV